MAGSCWVAIFYHRGTSYQSPETTSLFATNQLLSIKRPIIKVWRLLSSGLYSPSIKGNLKTNVLFFL